MSNTQSIEARTVSLALVTGGSRGLGRSMAQSLADRGVDTVITYKSRDDEARAVVAAIEAKGRRAIALRLDVADVKTYPAFVDALRAELRRVWQRDTIDALVNNAGTGAHASFATTTEAQFDELVNVHLKSAFFLTQALLPVLADGGRIVNVSSGLARFTYPGYAAYAAMKGGVEVLTRYMAKELGPRGISVNTLAPGAIETDFGGGAVRDDAELNAAIAAQTSLGRVGRPDDVGGALTALLGPETRWINGQRIEVSGGIHL